MAQPCVSGMADGAFAFPFAALPLARDEADEGGDLFGGVTGGEVEDSDRGDPIYIGHLGA
jgi:hypothetical protein